MRERKRSWPAVSQSCRRTVRSSRYIVYAEYQQECIVRLGEERMYLGEEVDADGSLVCVVEGVVHEACDEGGFADFGSAGEPSVQVLRLNNPNSTKLTALFAEEDQPRCRRQDGPQVQGRESESSLELLQGIRVGPCCGGVGRHYGGVDVGQRRCFAGRIGR